MSRTRNRYLSGVFCIFVCALAVFVPLAGTAYPEETKGTRIYDPGVCTNCGITIDIQTMLAPGREHNVAYNMGYDSYRTSHEISDMPLGLYYLYLQAEGYKANGTKGKLIAVFHNTVAYMVLEDKKYNEVRKIYTGNPYKAYLKILMDMGVQIEICAVSMSGSGWKNEDLIQGVLVNSGAIGRLIELAEQGYTIIQP